MTTSEIFPAIAVGPIGRLWFEPAEEGNNKLFIFGEPARRDVSRSSTTRVPPNAHVPSGYARRRPEWLNLD